MSLIKTMRKQMAIWWEQTGQDHYGKLIFAGPVQIKCRWKDCVVNIVTAHEKVLSFTTIVYVDREMKVGDILKLGELDSTTLTDPQPDPFAFKIKKFDHCPNFKNHETLLTVYL